jgi:sulfur relay (sulfurtransferase) DsrC/TusE family protein
MGPLKVAVSCRQEPTMKVKTKVKAGVDEDGFIQEPDHWNDEVAK